MKVLLAGTGILAALCSVVFAQTFEIADIRSSAPDSSPYTHGSNRSMSSALLPNGRYEIRNATMADLIETAWGISAEEIAGGPSWLESDKFDVAAKVPAGADRSSLGLMLRSLLVERFQLKARTENREIPVFGLVRNGGPVKLREAESSGPSGCQRSVVVVTCRNTTMAELARRVRGWDPGLIDRPVVDLTGLEGAWNFSVTFQTAASLFDALDKQIGIQLVPQNHSMPVLVVTHVNRTPSENPDAVTGRMPPPIMRFDVAEVRPSPAHGLPPSGGFLPGERIDLHSYTLKQLIGLAWEFDDNNMIAGGPKWLGVDRFDVIARSPIIHTTMEDMRMMLRSLLVQEFRLVTHTAARPRPVYAILSGKSPRVEKADPASRSECRLSIRLADSGGSAVPMKVFACRNTSMAQLASKLRAIDAADIDHPVVDLSGIPGAWDFSLTFSANSASSRTPSRDAGLLAEPDGRITIFDAFEKQLGLELAAQTRPIAVLVIDSAEPATGG
jgi:uncharacterized protein (TIGR03435 family)